MTDDGVRIAVIPRNRREALVVSLSTFKGQNLLNTRSWVMEGDEPTMPTKSGFGLKVALIPELRDALAKAEEEARRLGWLK